MSVYTQEYNPMTTNAGTALLTPDSDQDTRESWETPWSENDLGVDVLNPQSAAGDDLDDDEAYFLEDDDDDDDYDSDDYDDEDEEDDDLDEDSDDDIDDEEL
jgi:hypothetical protein